MGCFDSLLQVRGARSILVFLHGTLSPVLPLHLPKQDVHAMTPAKQWASRPLEVPRNYKTSPVEMLSSGINNSKYDGPSFLVEIRYRVPQIDCNLVLVII